MQSMLDFAQTHAEVSFNELPLTPVDGVILAQLAYFAFDQLPTASGMLGGLTRPKQVTLLTQDTWRPEANAQLLHTLAKAPRYQHIIWHDQVQQLDLDAQKQFSAITFSLPNQQQYLAFRGTRAAFVDWKEDFNMAYMQTIPSQKAALAYLKTIAAAYPGPLILGGHSKGGTLATYAFVKAPKHLQARISATYNADGPGLGEALPEALMSRLHKLVPQTSLIGTLFDPTAGFSVVKSDAHGFGQHDPFSWEVANEDFVSLPKTDQLSQLAQTTIATWTASLDEATKEACLNAAYALITQTDATSFAELKADWPHNAQAIFSGLRHGDPMARQQWLFAIGQLIVALRGAILPTLSKPQRPHFDWPWANAKHEKTDQ
ncbi:MAG: DUF2974 domain-containing protein [Lactobacillus sp.]|jgi:hypothetical protein|uniref:Mbeg1-like protein n=1 Tax=Lacticaseibacillus suilingensis TaxID=2799577 RepID=A0ABW4BGP8_9LACO|nr:Mbeg1-like protein [Lacticaseibacillus suilingensis]MCI1894031.1 DUF2974 domain-containing protein [Lactobacillus sp.]MCI1942036.1 DUF2974 domain-containing protein [Lactobacillus sp.]MCI2016715.1 DUF2974 domain-containing protein [Lactobacillus sp.]MCI2038394.1 DUF2974 domain-containing protein [Lactobacillus sp.]